MSRSNAALVSPKSPHEKDMVADGGAQGPMSLQDAADSHGHEMHPQKFVRLVGCHEANPEIHDGVRRVS
jgi:hypothetical protein